MMCSTPDQTTLMLHPSLPSLSTQNLFLLLPIVEGVNHDLQK